MPLSYRLIQSPDLHFTKVMIYVLKRNTEYTLSSYIDFWWLHSRWWRAGSKCTLCKQFNVILYQHSDAFLCIGCMSSIIATLLIVAEDFYVISSTLWYIVYTTDMYKTPYEMRYSREIYTLVCFSSFMLYFSWIYLGYIYHTQIFKL